MSKDFAKGEKPKRPRLTCAEDLEDWRAWTNNQSKRMRAASQIRTKPPKRVDL